jgi:putative hemolysin
VGTLETLVVLVCIAISAFLSSAEIALFSLSKYQLKMIRDRFRNAHRIIKRLLSDPSGVLITTLILNEVMNISLSTLIVEAVAGYDLKHFIQIFPLLESGNIPEWALEMFFSTLITTPVVLIFCEITPKVVAARANTIVAPFTSPLLSFLYYLITPLRLSIQFILKSLAFFVPGRKKGPLLSNIVAKKINEEDFLVIAEEAHKEGNIQSSELGLIRNVFELDDTAVVEITTPLSRVFTLASHTKIHDAISQVRNQAKGKSFSRVPVTGKSKNDIVGILYSKDLLISKMNREELQQPISTITWKPYTISQNTRLNAVFRRMKKQRTHMAIVTNERGQPIGIVTMHDVLEALLDELLSKEKKITGELTVP